MYFPVPQSLKAEHDELHAQLARATKAGGRTGAAAQTVARIMHPHFQREEEYALPPLSLLGELAKGRVKGSMSAVLEMTDKLEVELPTMLSEHRDIVTALTTLIAAATAESKLEFASFAEQLMAHAKTEEEVSYPTVLLIGRYLKAALPGTKRKPA